MKTQQDIEMGANKRYLNIFLDLRHTTNYRCRACRRLGDAPPTSATPINRQSSAWCTAGHFSPSCTAHMSFNTNTDISLGGPGKQK